MEVIVWVMKQSVSMCGYLEEVTDIQRVFGTVVPYFL
jgi:hypothetical protein